MNEHNEPKYRNKWEEVSRKGHVLIRIYRKYGKNFFRIYSFLILFIIRKFTRRLNKAKEGSFLNVKSFIFLFNFHTSFYFALFHD